LIKPVRRSAALGEVERGAQLLKAPVEVGFGDDQGRARRMVEPWVSLTRTRR